MYTNTALDFGPDVVPLGARHQELGRRRGVPADGGGNNIAVVQGLQQNGVDMKASVLAPATARTSSTRPAAKDFPSSAYFLDSYKPVELKNAATKKFQADLKKYAGFTGVPDFGVYNGYITRRPAHQGLRERRARTSTRQGFVDGVHKVGKYDQAGLACQPVDVSLEGRGHASEDLVRLVPPGEGRQVRAVPEERQAGHRHARRHCPKAIQKATNGGADRSADDRTDHGRARILTTSHDPRTP